MRRCFLAAGALICLVAGPVQAANLLTNGDFSAGNSGFATDYAFESFISSEGQYTVTAANTINNVNSFHDWTAIDTDPTGGTGNILVANGATEFWNRGVVRNGLGHSEHQLHVQLLRGRRQRGPRERRNSYTVLPSNRCNRGERARHERGLGR